MKIGILGGGFTGLTAAYYLSKKGHEVALLERGEVFGGLASGFKKPHWDWHLERTYHHLFSNDYDILGLSKDMGFDNIVFQEPQTASLYKSGMYPIDNPIDFLRLPLLPFPQKLRAGMVLAFLRISPFFSQYEKVTAEEFLKKTMGNQAWDVLWQELFRKKFGKYAGNILASFFWARIKKRTKSLGYPEGGFQRFIDHVIFAGQNNGAVLKNKTQILSVQKKGSGFSVIHKTGERIEEGRYDAIISTLPTPVLTSITKDVFSDSYLSRLKKIEYLYAINLVIETKEPFLKDVYWLNNNVKELFPMVFVQHTNFIDKKHYGGNHIAYIGNYIDTDSPLLRMTDKEVFDFYKEHLQKINPGYSFSTADYSVFRAAFAQPIFDKEFLKNKPDFETPMKNFFIANLDMTYPYDRGTNYAVALGKQAADFI